MVYLRILCNLILIFTVFEHSKINYARGFIKPLANFDKYLSTINYTSKPLLRQTSADVSKQRTENSTQIRSLIAVSLLPSPVSESPVSTRKLILHDYLFF